MNLTSLSKFLQETIFPNNQERIGFLELIKKQTNETINSQIYAYFLGCKIPEIRDAFMDGLMSILDNRVDKKFTLVEPSINTEVTTKTGKRIDIVIEDYQSQSVIIIENKINHDVNNPFKEYWVHYDKYLKSNRIGVLLTKHPEPIPEEVKDFYVNITHKEWIGNVKSILDLSILDNKNKVYLSDFFNTIDNLTKSHTMNESASFYFQNAQKINEALNTREHAVYYINTQFDFVANQIGLESRGREFWRNFRDNKNEINTFLTVIVQDLMYGGNSIMIILELSKDDVNKLESLDQQLNIHPQFSTKKKGEVKSNHYAHYLTSVYELNQEELANLGETIVKYIRQDFADILIEAIKLNYSAIDISHWEKQLLNSDISSI